MKKITLILIPLFVVLIITPILLVSHETIWAQTTCTYTPDPSGWQTTNEQMYYKLETDSSFALIPTGKITVSSGNTPLASDNGYFKVEANGVARALFRDPNLIDAAGETLGYRKETVGGSVTFWFGMNFTQDVTIKLYHRHGLSSWPLSWIIRVACPTPTPTPTRTPTQTPTPKPVITVTPTPKPVVTVTPAPTPIIPNQPPTPAVTSVNPTVLYRGDANQTMLITGQDFSNVVSGYPRVYLGDGVNVGTVTLNSATQLAVQILNVIADTPLGSRDVLVKNDAANINTLLNAFTVGDRATSAVSVCVGYNYEQQMPLPGVKLPRITGVASVFEGGTLVLKAEAEVDPQGWAFFYWCTKQGQLECAAADCQTVKFTGSASSPDLAKITVQVGDTLGYIDIYAVALKPNATLTVKKAGSGRGTVMVGTQTCDADCTVLQVAQTDKTALVLKAIPAAGSRFVRWETSDGCILTASVFRAEPGVTVVAVFEKR